MLCILVSLAMLLLCPVCITAVDQDANPNLVAKEKDANTWLDIATLLLPNDSDWFYDHNENPKFTFEPGSVTNADCATFPAICGHGLTVALLNLGPCSMLPPHLHPRAANAVVAMSGSTTTYMIQENGARMVTETLTPGQMTIFPRGSMHTMVNNGCTNSQLVSALSSDDAGTLNVANAMWEFPYDFVARILGLDVSQYNASAGSIPPIGTGSNSGFPDCMARCNQTGSPMRMIR